MVPIKPEKRHALTELFAHYPWQRVIIDAVLEEGYGSVAADSEEEPEVALLKLDILAMPAGNLDHPLARDFIQELSDSLILAESEAWRQAIIQVHGAKIKKQPRVGFSIETLDLDHVRRLAQFVPQGYQVKRIDLELAPRAMGHLAYASAAEFIDRGIGFCALWGDDPVCKARSYINSSNAIEISIMTDPVHQRKGLAIATGAALVAHCLEHGIEPHWNAINPISVRVAERLGYVQSGNFDLLKLGLEGA